MPGSTPHSSLREDFATVRNVVLGVEWKMLPEDQLGLRALRRIQNQVQEFVFAAGICGHGADVGLEPYDGEDGVEYRCHVCKEPR